jgi:gliding motility-associated-like protein
MTFRQAVVLAIALIISYATHSQTTESAHNKPVYRTVNNQAEYQRAKLEGQIPVLSQSMISDYNKLPQINMQSQARDAARVLELAGGQRGGGGGNECDCLLELDETFSVVPFLGGVPPDYRNDDSYTNVIDLPFDFCLYGDTYNSCYINNNGNISFQSAYATYSAEGFPSANYIMVAPFWADVDTDGPGSGLVYYKITDHSLIVSWDAVGYFPSADNLLNTFQLIITDGLDPILEGGNNVSFCYGDMQWTTGSASGGIDGFGGTPATVGANKGDGAAFVQFGRFDMPGQTYDGPFNNSDGISWLDNKNFVFNTCQVDNNIAPFAPSTGLCDTLIICQGGASYLQFLGPEQNQTVTIESSVDVPGQLIVIASPQPGSTTVYFTAEENATPGVYVLTITGTDDGDPNLSTTVQYYVEVTSDVVPPVDVLGPEAVCTGSEVEVFVNDIYDSYLWNSGEADTSMTVYGPGTYSLLVTIGACQRYEEFDIAGYPSPEPQIIATETELCIGQTTTLSVLDIYSTYEWDFNANNSDTSFVAGVGNHNLTVTNEFGCEGSDVYFISTQTIAVEIVAEEAQICPGDLTTLSTVNSYQTYVWDNNSDNNLPAFVTGVGSHDVTVTDADGCSGTDTFTITNLSNPTPNIIGETIICENGTSGLSVSSSFVSYIWDNNADNSGIAFDAGVGTHTVTVTDDNGCEGEDSFVITAFPDPVLPSDNLICDFPSEYEITVNNAPVPLGTWSVSANSPGSASFNPSDSISSTVAVSNFGQYEMTFTDECGNTDQITLTFLPEPFFTISDTTICEDDSLQYAGSSQYASFFNWSWSDGTNTQLNMVNADTDYIITASNQCGTYNADLQVGGHPCNIIIPNIFTPNNDDAGLNNTFKITGIEFFPGSSMLIFDRWGKKVYESNNYQNDWSGSNCADGVYFFIFGLQRINATEFFEGNITLVR